ncbi:MAG TPA: tetratricopeptide repeat protein, partial [Propionibacteriaceae bacterium]
SGVLQLRARRAAALVLGGDYRSALPVFDALFEAYRRTAGPNSRDALDCLQQAAHCRAALGHTTAALRQFQQVLAGVRAVEGDASPTALDLRRNVGQLLLAEDRAPEALDVLRPLYDDLCLVYGPQHPDSQEIKDLLTRIRLARG